MTQYEYKVIKCSISWQEHYTSFLSSFGWQVQNIQQTIDRIVNNNVGLSTTIWGFGIQQGAGVQDVETSLTITFVRDMDMPNRHEIIPIENRFWDAHPAYRKRAAEQYLVTKHGDWPEFQVLMECNRQALAIRNRKTPQVTSQSSSQQPVSQSSDHPPAPVAIPSEPATAVFKDMEVTHNVFQADQPGMQIRLHFNIKNRKGLQCRMVVYFTDADQNPLKDVNQKFKTADGKVSVGSVFTPGYEDCYYKN